MKKFMLLFLSIALSYSCFAINITWNGGTGKWTKATNWSPAQVPGPNDRAIIPSGTAHILNPTSAINSLLIATGGALIIEPGLSLQVVGSTSNSSIENSGQFNNYGTLEVLNGTTSNPIGIFNNGTFFNRPGATLLIENMWRGFENSFNAYANNEGTWTINGASSSGFLNRSLFVCLGDLTIEDCYIGFLNNGEVTNQGNLSIDHPSLVGLLNQGDWNNFTNGSLSISDYGSNGIQNYNSGVFENNGASVFINHTNGANDLFNSGKVYNLNCSEMHFTYRLRNLGNGIFSNEAWLFSTSSANHVNSSTATFINEGVIHDPDNAFINVTMQNSGIIVKPITGPIYVGQPVANVLGLGNLNGFIVGYWVDPGINFKVGSYDENNNEFTPNSDGVGLSTIKVQISYGSCGSRYLTIPISGGIQYPPSPFLIPDNTQNDVVSSTPLDVIVFPNPARNFVNISLLNEKGHNGFCQIQLLDLNGKKLDQKTVDTQIRTATFLTQYYPSGLYTLHILDESGNRTIKKLVIE